jgi:O-antigen/teichoic acid export membrane protein
VNSLARIIQIMVLATVVVVAVYLVLWSADSWADWVVLGVVVVTAWAVALGLYAREFPVKGKRSIRRTSRDRWRDDR